MHRYVHIYCCMHKCQYTYGCRRIAGVGQVCLGTGLDYRYRVTTKSNGNHCLTVSTFARRPAETPVHRGSSGGARGRRRPPDGEEEPALRMRRSAGGARRARGAERAAGAVKAARRTRRAGNAAGRGSVLPAIPRSSAASVSQWCQCSVQYS